MKTIIGAINKFKGELKSNTQLVISDGRDNGYYESCLDYIASDYYKLVCTRDEFNAKVDFLESNMGMANMHLLHNYRDAVSIGAINKDNPKPVFTQVMANSGQLPSVGMEFMGKGYAYKADTEEWFKLEALGVYDGNVIAKSCSESGKVQLYSEFKPIDQRTDREKAFDKGVDDLANHLDSDVDGQNSSEIAIGIMNLIKDGDLTAVEYTGK